MPITTIEIGTKLWVTLHNSTWSDAGRVQLLGLYQAPAHSIESAMDQQDRSTMVDITQLSEVKRQLVHEYLNGAVRHRPTVQAVRSPQLAEEQRPVGRRWGHVSLRGLSLDDYPSVAALESRYGLGLQSYDQWSHVWLNNPAYWERRHNWPIGWVLENERKQIVGSHGNIPLLYELRGKRIIAASGRGTVVESSYRGYSLWLLTTFFEQETADLCFDTSANFEAAQDNAALGALRVPVGAWDRHVFWITNYRDTLSIYLKRYMPHRLSSLVASLCYPFAAAAIFLKDALAMPALKRGLRELAIECCTAFDERFDEFWEDLRKENPDVLLAVRNRESLEWHFAHALPEKRLWIWTVTQDSRVVAYAIFLKLQDPESGVTRVSLVDFQSLGRNAALLLPMLAAALERCRRERVHLLENVGLSFEKSGINRFAPYKRRNRCWTYFYKARDKGLTDILSNPNAWAPSLYDGDASIS
jgi:hypothetical protein